ncbi:RNA-binding protein 1-like isoform X2 [Telopea speciosissima]|uniref:RNA-binding protein 1-like isoform X1 n=1 Tax=Telopea speciosissima TaxID=54955 RepID=UPI001CC6AF2E|nr:RNA-binding protein 1-like isoform X1 [Telopea speciosissima]XP_043722801.1 RNA-binding protein 1-like isoform X2 [Telopea speciosissima]
MGEPYWRYGAVAAPSAAERDTTSRTAFPGYSPSNPALTTHHLSSNNLRGSSSDYLHKDVLPLRPGAYGLDDIGGIAGHAALGPSGLTAGASINRFPSPLEDPALISQRRDVSLGINPSMPGMLSERSNSLRKSDSLSVEESNVLFVDGLPNDCTRREVAHLFRPFIGFKEIRVVHKEPRRTGDKAMVLCFVEFDDAKCAGTALEALQGYKFDDKKPDAPVLRIQFAHFPFRPPSDHDERRRGLSR